MADEKRSRRQARLAPYERIKRHVLGAIRAGRWSVGAEVPSENALAARFGVARMTARRALQELAQEGWLVRTQGRGTFVADQKPVLSMLEVRNIADEIAARGGRHGSRVLMLEAIAVPSGIGMHLDIPAGTRVFHSLIVHTDADTPVQIEDRFTNPRAAPDYLAQDFATITPNAYLSRVAPVEAIEHIVEAVLPDRATAAMLELRTPEPCLRIDRRTWAGGHVASFARLLHPGSRYRLGSYVALPRPSASTRPSPSTRLRP